MLLPTFSLPGSQFSPFRPTSNRISWLVIMSLPGSERQLWPLFSLCATSITKTSGSRKTKASHRGRLIRAIHSHKESCRNSLRVGRVYDRYSSAYVTWLILLDSSRKKQACNLVTAELRGSRISSYRNYFLEIYICRCVSPYPTTSSREKSPDLFWDRVSYHSHPQRPYQIEFAYLPETTSSRRGWI